MRIGANKHRGTKWFRFLDAAYIVLKEHGDCLPAAEIYARVLDRGLCNARYMPKSPSQTGQIFRFDDLKRFETVVVGPASNRVYEFGLLPEDG